MVDSLLLTLHKLSIVSRATPKVKRAAPKDRILSHLKKRRKVPDPEAYRIHSQIHRQSKRIGRRNKIKRRKTNLKINRIKRKRNKKSSLLKLKLKKKGPSIMNLEPMKKEPSPTTSNPMRRRPSLTIFTNFPNRS